MPDASLFESETMLPSPINPGEDLALAGDSHERAAAAAAAAYRLELGRNRVALIKLLPVASINLTADEQQNVQVYQMASLVLGAVAAAPMICSDDCPAAFKNPCPLARIGRHPIGDRCPFEQQYVSERFLAWMYELGRTLDTLMESERSSITSLVMLDLQERRCNAVLAQAHTSDLVGQSVRDVDPISGRILAWEDVIHVNAERLNEIIDKRRMLLKDLELTREMVTKRQKMLGQLRAGNDSGLANRQSDKADMIRRNLRGEPVVIDLSAR